MPTPLAAGCPETHQWPFLRPQSPPHRIWRAGLPLTWASLDNGVLQLSWGVLCIWPVSISCQSCPWPVASPSGQACSSGRDTVGHSRQGWPPPLTVPSGTSMVGQPSEQPFVPVGIWAGGISAGMGWQPGCHRHHQPALPGAFLCLRETSSPVRGGGLCLLCWTVAGWQMLRTLSAAPGRWNTWGPRRPSPLPVSLYFVLDDSTDPSSAVSDLLLNPCLSFNSWLL